MNRLIAEAVGTFCLVFAGTGAIVINHATGGAVTHVGVALTFGLVVAAMIYSLGDISGAHLNPAVSLGLVLAGRFPARSLAPFTLAQLAGALAASALLCVLFPESDSLGATIPRGPAWRSLILETVLTFILMLVILRVSSGPRERAITAGLVIGAVVGLEALFAGPISGASMNPARSAAPAIVSGHLGSLGSLWIYILAPVLGASAAVGASAAIAPRDAPGFAQ